jgi:hypothetical protein
MFLLHKVIGFYELVRPCMKNQRKACCLLFYPGLRIKMRNPRQQSDKPKYLPQAFTLNISSFHS